MKVETDKIAKMFDYLYNPSDPLTKANGAFVGGRWDPIVAKKASRLYNEGLVDYLMFIGGIGKDSGILTRLNVPEAIFQAALANTVHGVPENKIYVEPRPTNGGDCCRFGIETIVETGLPCENLIMVMHSTSLRRMDAVMKVIAREKNFQAKFQRCGTGYEFNPGNLVDQQEVVAEIVRLADWPAKGWCEAQGDLPVGLVEYAREIKDII